MIKIICDVCQKDMEGGWYSTIKTWGTYPTVGYTEQTIHVCDGCNKKIQGFIVDLKREGVGR